MTTYCRMSPECHVMLYKSLGGYQFHLASGVTLEDGEESDILVRTVHEAISKLKLYQSRGFGVPQDAINFLIEDSKK